MNEWAGVIMAAGQGRRMVSRLPKPLHRVCGKELVRYPVELLQSLGIARILVVVSPENGAAIGNLLGDGVDYVTQPTPRGTGDAAARALDVLPPEVEHLLLLGGDSPLLSRPSALRLVEEHRNRGNDMTMLTAADMPAGDLGRVIRDEAGRVVKLVEAADWEGDEFAPAEVNAGLYCFNRQWLAAALSGVAPAANGEKQLTALVGHGPAGSRIDGRPSQWPEEIFGVNDRVQLAQVEAVMRWQICEKWLRAGVTIQDPASVFIDAEVEIGQDTVIRPNTMLQGATQIGEDCEIGPNAVIRDSRIGPRCRVTASMLEEATLEAEADVGPFSHLRPGAYLESGVHVGNFVEVKESRLGAGTLAGHFSYLGDAAVGAGVNIGAGTITCNFDGRDKHRTNIGAGAFIGCDTMLIAPVSVGRQAATGAGAVVNKDVPEGLLAVGVPARIIPGKPRADRKAADD